MSTPVDSTFIFTKHRENRLKVLPLSLVHTRGTEERH